jgi:hypothetical protein
VSLSLRAERSDEKEGKRVGYWCDGSEDLMFDAG